MEFTTTVADGPRTSALAKALAAYNASHFDQQLTIESFVQKMVDQHMDSLVQSYVVTKIPHVDFLMRMTQEERIAIRTEAAQNPAIADLLEMLKAAGNEVDLTSAITVAGLQALEDAELLAPGRAAEIRAL